MKKIVILNGIHGSGKSTLARLLAKEDDAFFSFPEIGGQLRLVVGSNALSSGEDFDREVMRREWERDSKVLQCEKIPLVETWHVGNLAYVQVRNPRLEKHYRSKLEERLNCFSVVSILIDISWDTFRIRATEKIAPFEMDQLISFYARVLEATYALCEAYRIPHLTIRNEGSIDKTMHDARRFLSSQELLV